MRRARALLLIPFCLALASAQNTVSVRILLGAADKEPTRWDGSLQVDGAHLDSLEPWRFEGADAITGAAWRVGTHPVRLFGGGTQVNGQQVRQIVANGVIAKLSQAAENTVLSVTTAQGNFEIRLSEIPYGTGVAKLDGKAFADRIPPTARITESPEEEDFPSAAADKDGGIWMAYVSFRHNPDHDRLRARLQTPIADFSRLKAAPGGDQIFARRRMGGTWGPAIAITGPGGDLYRTSVAIDGRGRAWVFWSANNKGNFDVFARPILNGTPGRTVQISREAGSDVDAVAATDSSGRVWVAWQGWRAGKAGIFGAMQKGDSFTAPFAIAQSSGNEWNPAIAADRSGRVTVAWDSYRDGNYDIYMRTAAATGSWGTPKAVAATARYEAYPSLAYDAAGKLWVAYEEGGRGWGKDFGAYDTNGVAVYQGRAIRIRGFEADGRTIELPIDVGTVLPGVPTLRVDRNGTQSAADSLDPNPDAAKRRVANRPAPNQQNPKNTMPRLLVDASGRMWLAFRSAQPIWWNPIGTVWTEHAVSFDGARWTPPIFLSHSDNLLDNRPALVSTSPGQLTVIGSSDSRRQFQLGERRGPTSNDQPAPPEDPYNNDLFTNEIALGGTAQPASRPATMAGGEKSPADPVEVGALKRMREYRTAGAAGMRLVRGEFHRHSEISMDGGFDGSIFDQWRYILDAGSLDWVGCCDHDNGGGREYSWWLIQKLTDIYYSPGKFVPMFNYERSVPYPEGHRNVIFAQRGIRPLPRLPISGVDAPGHAPDTQMLYAYLKFFNGVTASHTSGTNMGTDWRDNDPSVEPVVEIYQGDRQNYEMPDAPRSNSAADSIGGWRPKGFVNLALAKGYQLGFQASSDHVSTHMSYCNIFVNDATRESVLDGLRKRHVYGSTDNILADVRSGSHMMGDVFSTTARPSLQVKLTGTSNFSKVHVIKDNNYVYSIQPNSPNVSFSWMDNAAAAGKTSYYYVRGEQDNGEIVWVSPMWITYSGSR
ncbi:MAG: hypothetical protein M3Z09_03040 [Acidobacteriota bacterium]|nr:hypothetical protein [Acidobacteriota bacterium]